MELTPEHLRAAENLSLGYEAMLAAQRELRAMPAHMRWKEVSGRDYLYETPPARGPEVSRGPRNAESEARYHSYTARRAELEARVESTRRALQPTLAQYRALRLPRVQGLPARILRTLDLRGHLGTDFLVVGTNAFPAYEIEARERFARGLDETEDFDLGWCRGAEASQGAMASAVGSPLLEALREVDPTFEMGDRRFRAVNARGYEVELLAAPSVFRSLQEGDPFSPVPLREQEWLLRGRALRHVVAATDGSPAPLVVPDPRWMALHKLWLAAKPARKGTKRDKDHLQGDLLLGAVTRRMGQAYPVDADFVLGLPEELLEHFNAWARRHHFVPGAAPAGWR